MPLTTDELEKKSAEELEQIKRNELDKLIYRKQSIEHSSARISKGASVYVNYCEAIKRSLKTMNPKSIHSLRLKVELEENEFKAKELVTLFKKNNREYESYIKPQINDLVKELGIKKVDYKNLEHEADLLVKTELYGSVHVLASNLEHTSMMKHYRKYITILKNLSSAIFVKWETANDQLERCRLEKEMYDINLQIENLEQRASKRNNYYNTVFLPQHQQDKKEMDLYFDKFLERGKELAKIGIDPKLSYMLDEYEKQDHSDQEQEVLFFSALRNRVEDIISVMNEDQIGNKKYLHLMTKIRE